jgi:hypothetical protein
MPSVNVMYAAMEKTAGSIYHRITFLPIITPRDVTCLEFVLSRIEFPLDLCSALAQKYPLSERTYLEIAFLADGLEDDL